MKILLCSHRFAPDIGGIETVSALLAEEFARLGHEVCVWTRTTGQDAVARSYRVVRGAGRRELFEQARWCDIFFQNNISLQNLWAALLLHTPLVIAHHTWLTAPDGRATWQTLLKRWLLRRARNITISEAIAGHIGAPSTLIDNPFDASLFRPLPGVARDHPLVCLGRLVSDKGVDVLIAALGLLAATGKRPQLTIIGTGPEEAALRAQARALGVADQIQFAGALTGEALARCLNQHRILVAPSRWAEPFGLIALEGIGCGCVVIGSEQGGLPRAIGLCGLTFPNGDAPALAATLERVLVDDALAAQLRSGAEAHLASHSPATVAAAYLRVFSAAIE